MRTAKPPPPPAQDDRPSRTAIAAEHKSRRAWGGSGFSFYFVRGLPFVTRREYRERHRSQEAQRAVDLSRALRKLALEFPRFKPDINRLEHRVLVQVRSPDWKCKKLLKYLGAEPISISELAEDSGLDVPSIRNTLELLTTNGLVQPCNRHGQTTATRGHAKKSYWRKAI